MNRKNPERKPDMLRDTLHAMVFSSWSIYAWTFIAFGFWAVSIEFLILGFREDKVSEVLGVLVAFTMMALMTTSMAINIWLAKLTKKKQGPIKKILG